MRPMILAGRSDHAAGCRYLGCAICRSESENALCK
jgi:hypothetical protein